MTKPVSQESQGLPHAGMPALAKLQDRRCGCWTAPPEKSFPGRALASCVSSGPGGGDYRTVDLLSVPVIRDYYSSGTVWGKYSSESARGK